MTGESKRDYEPIDAVQEAMGIMGRWHIIIAIALSLINFPVAWQQLSIAFLAPEAKFDCSLPRPSINVSQPESSCLVNVGNGTIENCREFHYDRTEFQETIITEWDLVCNRRQLANVAQLCTMVGILVGNMVFGMMADRIGRKNPLMIAVVIQSLTALLSTFSPWYELFILLRFASAVATGGTMLISFVLLMEIVGIEWRATLSVLFHIPFILGHITIPLISYLTRSWKLFQLVISLPPILLLSYYWLIPESPRWLLAVGRIGQAREVLTSAATKNNIPLEKVGEAIESHENNVKHKTDSDNQVKYNITDLFKTPNLRVMSICVALNWFVCGMGYFGVAQFISKLGGNIFYNVALSAVLQIPGTLIVLYLISRVSRLKILIGSELVTSACLLLIMVIPDATIRVVLASIGLASIAISFPTVYLYTGEVFPTVVRNNGLGMCSVAARVGSSLAPFIADMGILAHWLPPVIFGVGPLLGAVLCLLLPETMGCELPETIEDGENFRKKRNALAE